MLHLIDKSHGMMAQSLSSGTAACVGTRISSIIKSYLKHMKKITLNYSIFATLFSIFSNRDVDDKKMNTS
jgi:hypothetical protein